MASSSPCCSSKSHLAPISTSATSSRKHLLNWPFGSSHLWRTERVGSWLPSEAVPWGACPRGLWAVCGQTRPRHASSPLSSASLLLQPCLSSGAAFSSSGPGLWTAAPPRAAPLTPIWHQARYHFRRPHWAAQPRALSPRMSAPTLTPLTSPQLHTEDPLPATFISASEGGL